MPLKLSCEKHRILLLSAALVVLTFAAFEVVRHNDFVKFDDPEYLTENTRVQSGLSGDSIAWAFTSGDAANWHPLTWISHILDVQVFGLNPAGHHLHSLTLHIIATLLLFWVLHSMTGAAWRSAFVALVFGIHPIHVESVAWAAERKDVLCAVFWMLTMGAYVSYAKRGGVFRYLLVVLCLALGLMAKPMIVTLPVVLLALDFWPLGRLSRGDAAQTNEKTCRSASLSRLILEKVPLFALALASCVITFLVQQSGGAVAGLDVPLMYRVANAVLSYGMYLYKMGLPIHLAVIYPLPPEGWPVWKPLLSALILIAITVLILRSARKRPYLLAGWIWYLVTLVPVIGLVQVGSQAMADRYTYLPSIGILVLFAWGVADLTARWSGRRIVLAVLGGVLTILMIAGTRTQVAYWKNGATLYAHALAVTENNYALHCCLGTVLEDEGRLDDAEKEYRESIRICPTFADALLCLGQIQMLKSDYAGAIESYGQARKVSGSDFRILYKIGEVLVKQGMYEDAADLYRQCLRMNPGFAKGHLALGQVLAGLGKYDEALKSYDQAKRLDPTDPRLYYMIGAVKAQQNALDQAAELFRQSIRMSPNMVEAYCGLGVVLHRQNRTDEAIAQFRAALKIKPDESEVWSHLGDCLQVQGKLAEAGDAYNQSLKIQPNEAAAHSKLGDVLKNQGKVKEAVAEHIKALEVKPDFGPSLNNLAWIYATSKDPQFRNPSEAVPLAEKVCNATSYQDQNCLDTLAAAYAAAGQFDKAVETAQKAIALAKVVGDGAAVQDLLQKQKLYEAKQAYIAP